jgi:hypothetical protein
MIPLLGHPHLTADFEKLRDAVERWEETGAMSPAIERVDILIVSGIAAGSAPWIRPADWRLLYSNEDVAVLERRRERPR